MKCNGKNHCFVAIYACGPEEEQTVIRWCSYCGAIVIDLDVDGRTYSGYIMKMKFPETNYEN